MVSLHYAKGCGFLLGRKPAVIQSLIYVVMSLCRYIRGEGGIGAGHIHVDRLVIQVTRNGTRR
jgi:hypothetical protein